MEEFQVDIEKLFGSYSNSHVQLQAAYDHCANTTRNFNECVECAKSETPDAPPYIDECVAAIRRARCSAKFKGGVANADCNKIRQRCDFIPDNGPEARCVDLWDERLPKTSADGGDSLILELEAPAGMDIYSGKLDYCWRENPKYRDCLRCAADRYFNDPCNENKAKHLCAVHRGNKPQGKPKQSPFCVRIGDTCGRKALPFMGCPNPDVTPRDSLGLVDGDTESPLNCYVNTPGYRDCLRCVSEKATNGCELEAGKSRCWLQFNPDSKASESPFCHSVVEQCSGEDKPKIIGYPSAEALCLDNKNNLKSSYAGQEAYEIFLQALPAGYPLGKETEQYRVAYTTLPTDLVGGITCNPPIDDPTLPPRGDPTHQPWIDSQLKCCKCLIYGEARGETVPCQECALWVMYNRQKDDWDCSRNWGGGYKGLTGCAGNGPNAIPGGDREATYCRQSKMPETWEGGWPNSAFKRCFCSGTNYPYAQDDDANRKRIAKMCRDLSISNWKGLRDPTNGANYLFQCSKVPAWMQCNIDGGRCSKVEGQCSGCGNCFYRCNGTPQKCDYFTKKVDPRLEIYGPDDFIDDYGGGGIDNQPTVATVGDYISRKNVDGVAYMASGNGEDVIPEIDPYQYQYATSVDACARTTKGYRECLECVSNSPYLDYCQDARKKTQCWAKFGKRPEQTNRNNPFCDLIRSHCEVLNSGDPAVACFDETTPRISGTTSSFVRNTQSVSRDTTILSGSSEETTIAPAEEKEIPTKSVPDDGGKEPIDLSNYKISSTKQTLITYADLSIPKVNVKNLTSDRGGY